MIDDFDLMHSTPLEFYVNGRVFYDVPLNEKADTLEAVVSNVYVSRKFRYIVQEALRKHGISAADALNAFTFNLFHFLKRDGATDRMRPQYPRPSDGVW